MRMPEQTVSLRHHEGDTVEHDVRGLDDFVPGLPLLRFRGVREYTRDLLCKRDEGVT
jgi:hypothetical protein